VRGRLWRKSNPALSTEQKNLLVRKLSDARRALRGKQSTEERAMARRADDEAKQALGERGPVWWTNGAPDYHRKMARHTPYVDWYLGSKPVRATALTFAMDTRSCTRRVGVCLHAVGCRWQRRAAPELKILGVEA
jgi:hypothetical protein